jgi:hypothetical protein
MSEPARASADLRKQQTWLSTLVAVLSNLARGAADGHIAHRSRVPGAVQGPFERLAVALTLPEPVRPTP